MQTVFRLALGDVLRSRGRLAVFATGFKLLQVWLLAPAVAAGLSLVMARAGYVAVTDWDLLGFFLSPLGIIYLGLVGASVAVLLVAEQAGVTVLLDRADPLRPWPGGSAVGRVAWAFTQIVQLGLVQVGLLAFAAVPFVLILGLTQVVFLSTHDVNFYVSERPISFWLAVGIGGFVVLGAGAIGLRLLVRWAFAVPVIVFERRQARDALRTAQERVRGREWQVGFVLLGWHVLAFTLGGGIHLAFRLLAQQLPAGAAEDTRVLSGLLLLRGLLLAIVSAGSIIGHAALVRRMYLLVAAPPGVEPAPPSRPKMERLLTVGVLVLVGGPASIWAGLAVATDAPPRVHITAHRGHEHAAPENTLAAIRAAIDSGADAAEIDVQLTTDGIPVLVHDRDLMRVARNSRRPTELSLSDLKQVDVGAWFGPEFVGERVPTLAEVVSECRGRLRLNVELKYYGPDAGLAEAVARCLSGFESECVVTSFDRAALAEIQRVNPRLRVGPIVAAAVGDVSRLEGELLSVRADLLTSALVRHARATGRAIHVWTVNDERQALRLILKGADDLMTSNPDRLIPVRDRWAELTDAERLVLGSRVMLGLE